MSETPVMEASAFLMLETTCTGDTFHPHHSVASRLKPADGRGLGVSGCRRCVGAKRLNLSMPQRVNPFAGWTPEDIAMGRRWVETWKRAGEALERVHVKELRELDAYHAIALLCGPGVEQPRPASGLVEQQRWFMKVARNS